MNRLGQRHQFRSTLLVQRRRTARHCRKILQQGTELQACWDPEVTEDASSRSAQDQRRDRADACIARQVGFSVDITNSQRELIRQRGHVLQQLARFLAQPSLWPSWHDDDGLRLDEQVERYGSFQLLVEVSSKGRGFGFWNESHESTP